MARRAVWFLILAVFLSLVASSPLNALWTTNGVPLCTAVNSQAYSTITSDAEGGAIVAWADYRISENDIYVQRVDASGAALWAVDGIGLCLATGSQWHPKITSDGAGGAIVVWYDYRTGNHDIYAQRVSASGAALWTGDGAAICTAPGSQVYPVLASDGAGGAIIAWYDYRSGNYDIYAQRVDASGAVLWTANGVALCTASNEQSNAAITSDGAGGAIVTWIDLRGALGKPDIYAQRVDASGIVQWTANGVALCTEAEYQNDPRIASDGAGGAIVAWYDYRNPPIDVYAQRVSASGAVQWTADGVAICAASGGQWYQEIASDGAGGAIITWQDNRSGTYDIYAQRVNASGAVQWTVDGSALCTVAGTQTEPAIICDGAGGAIIAWHDFRSGSHNDIYAQRVNASGAIQWTIGGVALSAIAGEQTYPDMTSDGAGGIIAAWWDQRGSDYDIYSGHIDSKGRPGYRPPTIHSVMDVPGDEGGKVNLAWDASPFDRLSGEVTRYTVWRALATSAELALLGSGAALVSSPGEALEDAKGPVVRMSSFSGETFYWKLISSIDAYRLPGYSEIVSTLFDSTAVCDDYHYFQVIAHTASPSVYWISEPDSGYSVDNLAPCAPLCLAGEQSHAPEGLMLTWERNTEPDLDCYRVYRGLSEDFIPGPGNMIGAPCDTLHFDGGWRWDSGYYYKVSAVDIHGNESAYSLLRPEGVTGDETPAAPRASYLAQNYPNPFNPSTRITFGLAAPERVSLRVYDAAGRLVRVMVDGALPAGYYSESWNGLDEGGRAVASGVYFYRLDAGAFMQTKKMILLR